MLFTSSALFRIWHGCPEVRVISRCGRRVSPKPWQTNVNAPQVTNAPPPPPRTQSQTVSLCMCCMWETTTATRMIDDSLLDESNRGYLWWLSIWEEWQRQICMWFESIYMLSECWEYAEVCVIHYRKLTGNGAKLKAQFLNVWVGGQSWHLGMFEMVDIQKIFYLFVTFD